MEVILKTDIKGLGYKNDTVDVKPGYGRNYLIPQGFAIIASGSNKKMIAENIQQASHKAEKVKNDAEAVAAAIGDKALEIKAKVGDSGKIFGAVTTLQISDALKAMGIDVDRKKISFKGEVKYVGDYEVEIDLHKEVKKDVKFSVVAEQSHISDKAKALVPFIRDQGFFGYIDKFSESEKIFQDY